MLPFISKYENERYYVKDCDFIKNQKKIYDFGVTILLCKKDIFLF
jgi:hypothetical protein